MKKKVFSLMMTLLLAFMGVAKAEIVEIGSGTSTNSYLPTYEFYNYSFTQQIYTADEIGTTGTINAITLWMYGAADLYEMPFDIYMLEVDNEAFASVSICC